MTNCTKNNLIRFSDSENNNKDIINSKGIALIISCLQHIIHNDFEKIQELSRYLKNIDTFFYKINHPIVWSLQN